MTLQEPTCRDVRVRSLDDARLIFHGVWLGRLPMVTRRLSSEERARIRPGDVYVWEEKTQHHVEQAGLSIERWTDCFAWGPSRVRDEFLFYTQKDREYRRSNNRRNDMPPQQPGERWHKQTLSVIVKDPQDSYNNFPRKWHMTAYFHRDNLPSVQETLVGIPTPPAGMYEKARANRTNTRAAQGHSSASPSSDEGTAVYSGHYHSPGSPVRTMRESYRSMPYPPPSPSSSSSSGRRMSLSSASGSSTLASMTPIVQTQPLRPVLPSLPIPRGPHPSLPYPPAGADADADGMPYHLRPFGEPFSPVAQTSELKLPPPLSSTRFPEFALSLDGPVKAEGKRVVLGSPLRGSTPVGRRREDDAALRMFKFS
ncbi:hypothetical protein EXIGLDRAFT_845295 [Exidia glandulosa HHB12029]|uniref:Gti1/Pac2 family-domain-containing protein n=1 Tax=Exidia glandulosa HHB12029 TaxID=1314781 RepID=A0A165BJF4_EXIGL|nr:hypothetical protein EXIGLDRAFT_845295 [Exidia glandulosa HHB12029]